MDKIGLIGGAGPMAGALLFQQMIQICQQRYHCKEDGDFPYILLLSYPFVNMLKDEISDQEKDGLKKQLEDCFSTFNNCHVNFSAIACNTLHGFMDRPFVQKILNPKSQFIHMLEETGYELSTNKIKKAYVLASNTSVKLKLHQKYFECEYPNPIAQSKFQEIIDRVLTGECNQTLADQTIKEIDQLILSGRPEEKVAIVLGCTEFSVLNDRFPLTHPSKNCQIFDTSLIVAEKIIKLIFEQRSDE